MGLLCFLTVFCSCEDTYTFKSVETEEFANLIEDSSVVVVDVRTPEEFAEGHIPNAININAAQVEFGKQALNLLPKNKLIAVYCRSGRRSKKASNDLSKLGFQVVELNKGLKSWVSANKDTVASPDEDL